MIPGWMELVGSLAPLLMIVSVGVIIFGAYKLKIFMAARSLDREEEERKRKELLKKLGLKIANERLKH